MQPKIKQISAVARADGSGFVIFGIGSDSNVYVWDPIAGQWILEKVPDRQHQETDK